MTHNHSLLNLNDDLSADQLNRHIDNPPSDADDNYFWFVGSTIAQFYSLTEYDWALIRQLMPTASTPKIVLLTFSNTDENSTLGENIWQQFSPRSAALIPNCFAETIIAVPRTLLQPSATVFQNVADPFREWFIRMLTEQHQIAKGTIDTSLFTQQETITFPDTLRTLQLPALHPQKPNRHRAWLHKQLQTVSVDELLPNIVSVADATAFHSGLWQMNDDLEESHNLSQSVEGDGKFAAGDYWHAIMHRREPDPSNAKYWFRRVGEHPIFESLTQCAAQLLSQQLAPETEQHLQRLTTSSDWDPFAFVDFCEAAVRSDAPEMRRTAEQLQWCEMQLLLEQTARDATGT